jgi:hypothetical protein
MGNPYPERPETAVSLSRPGRIVEQLERCMASRLTPGRSGWSASAHLGRDLERFFGVRAPLPSIESALRVLARRGRVRLRADPDGRLWYRLVTDEG